MPPPAGKHKVAILIHLAKSRKRNSPYLRKPIEIKFAPIRKKKKESVLDVNPETIRHFLLTSIKEPITCDHFGCGKTLSNMEQLYGKTCFTHSISPNPPDPTNFVVYK